MISFFS